MQSSYERLQSSHALRSSYERLQSSSHRLRASYEQLEASYEPLRRTTTALRRYRRGRHSSGLDLRPLVGAVAAAVVLSGIGLASSTAATPNSNDTAATAALAAESDRLTADERGNRSHNRDTTQPSDQQSSGHKSAGQQRSAQKQSDQKSTPAPAPTKKAPVAGLDEIQMNNAQAIVEAGQEMNLPRRAYVVAIATALQESQLRNLANPGVPQSLNLPNEGTGQDYDSVGLFQQRASMGWGSVDELMTPKSSAKAFYSRLATIAGWEQMPVTVAAQTVQGSAFPDAYAKHESRAEEIVSGILQ
ncbi:hypothetical protein ACNTMW_15065 [Planosporangium sp. 12N6]|uniref:hypothetical protein n=1 Tax=Planosporangium spinosum TaxID=3402278 RepID=UPI003CFB9588